MHILPHQPMPHHRIGEGRLRHRRPLYFLHLCNDGVRPALGNRRGRARTVTLFSALDNLIKGGAGQAIQNMNLILGVDEKASLEDTGNWP